MRNKIRAFIIMVAFVFTAAIFFAVPVNADDNGEERTPVVIVIPLPTTEAPPAPEPKPEPPLEIDPIIEAENEAENEIESEIENEIETEDDINEREPIHPLLPPAGAFAGVVSILAVLKYIRTVI